MKTLASIATAAALCITSPLTYAYAQSAYGIQLPVRGGPDEPQGKVDEPRVDEATGLDLVEADSLSDAAAGAAQQAASDTPPKSGKSGFRRIESTSIFQDRNGNAGIMVTGVAFYQTDFPNPTAERIARRSAYVRAHAAAMRILTEKIYGASVEQKQAIASKVLEKTTGTSESRDEERASTNRIDSQTSGLIRGAQVWKCEDTGDSVRVWLFTTNDTATGNRHISSAKKITSLKDYAATVDSIVDDLRSNFLPPIGGKVVNCPERGYATYIGFGSAIIKEPGARAELDASRKAELRAKAGLASCMTGTEVNYTSSLTEQERVLVREAKQFGDALPPADGDAQLADALSSSLEATSEFQEATEMITRGTLPPAATDVQFVDDESGWYYYIYIYTVGSEDLVKGLRGDAKYLGGKDAGRKSGYDPKKRGPSGQGKDPRDGGTPHQ